MKQNVISTVFSLTALFLVGCNEDSSPTGTVTTDVITDKPVVVNVREIVFNSLEGTTDTVPVKIDENHAVLTVPASDVVDGYSKTSKSFVFTTVDVNKDLSTAYLSTGNNVDGLLTSIWTFNNTGASDTSFSYGKIWIDDNQSHIGDTTNSTYSVKDSAGHYSNSISIDIVVVQ